MSYASSHSVCVHGHFYQPPRENPWTGEIDPQESAGDYHDWNERITAECYDPNARARILGPDGKTTRLINNYSHISFNFGPTLMMWLEKKHPKIVAKILEADRESARKLKGHGNAIAQAFVHLILPLADPRDQKTVIAWGLSDFRRRFKRDAESLWLPETACNNQTLSCLIDAKMKYVILAPAQAARVRPLQSGGPWWEVSDGSVDPKRPYRWFESKENRDRFIDIFFYDGPISADVSFGKLMADAKVCADRISGAFGELREGSPLVSIATDGELYGHHHKFAEMGLAYLLNVELPQRNFDVVNYGYFLAKSSSLWEVQIQSGPQGLGTSWSCAHGVGRWFLDCGCGSEGQSQKWRAPMRLALNTLKSRLDALTERLGSTIFKDVWAARDDYDAVISDPAALADFMSRRLLKDSPSHRREAQSIMEMQKFGLYMFTSCGWFFSDIAGLEAVQNLKYARRAIEIAKEVSGKDLKPEFLDLLRQAPGNFPEFPNGEIVYQKLARP